MAIAAFGKLRKRVFSNSNIRASTKIMMYRAVVITTLLYASETWTIYCRHIEDLEAFNQKSLRIILNIKWQDFRTNISVLQQAGCPSIESLIVKSQLRWAGHVVRMHNSRLPKQIFYSELTEGSRHVGAPKKRFRDNLKSHMKSCLLDPASWETDAQDRAKWRKLIGDGVENFELQITRTILEKRDRRLLNRQNPTPHQNQFICQACGRVCGYRIGLMSHQRIHRG